MRVSIVQLCRSIYLKCVIDVSRGTIYLFIGRTLCSELFANELDVCIMFCFLKLNIVHVLLIPRVQVKLDIYRM